MKLIRVLSSAFACGAIALGFMAMAHAQQPLEPVQLQEKNPYNARQLNQTWYETEGDWQGLWTPTHQGAGDGAFTAVWHLNRQVERAMLQMTMTSPLAVQIVRTHADGRTCQYRGYFNNAGNVVTGTYTCTGSPRPMNWRASVGSRIAPSQAGDTPRAAALFDYLRVDWSETEGDWHGRWTQINPDTGDGYYNARWTKGNEHATATLEMSIDAAAGRMTVRRRDPDGRQCTYYGVINPNTLRSVTGTYRCSGQENSLPWRAAAIVPTP